MPPAPTTGPNLVPNPELAAQQAEEQVRNAVNAIPGDKVVQQYGDPADAEWLIRLPLQEGQEQGASLA